MSKTKEEQIKKAMADESWKTVKMEEYAKGNLELAITFLRMCLTQPQIFSQLVAALEDHRTQLIQIEEDKKQLELADKKAHPNG